MSAGSQAKPLFFRALGLSSGASDGARLDALKAHFSTNFDAMLEVRRHPRARRLTLRVKSRPRKVVLTMPKRATRREAHALIKEHYDWIVSQLRQGQSSVPFSDGQIVPLRGIDHRVRFSQTQRGRGVVSIVESGELPELHVFGEPEFCPRRFATWLKSEARKDLDAAVSTHATALNVKWKRISIRDQTSRWGSCSTTGTLSFSWRLILAPPFILDYVAAHEVAHLVEMNHSPRFWALVKRLYPDHKAAERWLSSDGRHLHAFSI